MGPMMEHVVKAIDFHHNYEDVITTSFELFSEVVAKMLPYLNTVSKIFFNIICITTRHLISITFYGFILRDSS